MKELRFYTNNHNKRNRHAEQAEAPPSRVLGKKAMPRRWTVDQCDIKERSGVNARVQCEGHSCSHERNVARTEDFALLSSRHDKMAFLRCMKKTARFSCLCWGELAHVVEQDAGQWLLAGREGRTLKPRVYHRRDGTILKKRLLSGRVHFGASPSKGTKNFQSVFGFIYL